MFERHTIVCETRDDHRYFALYRMGRVVFSSTVLEEVELVMEDYVKDDDDWHDKDHDPDGIYIRR